MGSPHLGKEQRRPHLGQSEDVNNSEDQFLDYGGDRGQGQGQEGRDHKQNSAREEVDQETTATPESLARMTIEGGGSSAVNDRNTFFAETQKPASARKK